MPEKMDISASSFIAVDGLKLRHLRSNGRQGTPVLLTSPWPESLYAFARIWPSLASEAPLVALDLPGFGKSEGRADVMSPKAMGEFLPEVIDTLGLGRVHAVGPDVGTSALLFAAHSHPELFESLVVGSGAMNVAMTAGGLREIIGAPSTKPFEGMTGEEFAAGSINRMMKSQPDPQILDDYKASSSRKRFIEAMAYVRAYPADLSELGAALPGIRTPVLSIWGAHDPIVSPKNASVLDVALPRTRSIVLDAGHFVWEDSADGYAAAVLEWIGGGYKSVK
jgi:pimeloyl-ACP methyl ester carboxylesterase